MKWKPLWHKSSNSCLFPLLDNVEVIAKYYICKSYVTVGTRTSRYLLKLEEIATADEYANDSSRTELI